jgi:putative selenate reductase molybdopterin-binding subunit
VSDFRVVGRSVRKVDSLGLARGDARFTADYDLPSPLVLGFLYSTEPHADIVRIDSETAEAMDGVTGVWDYRNTPGTLYTTAGQGYPEPSPYDFSLFDSRVRFVGDRVCMVAAESEKILEEALQAIRVEYRPLPAVFDTDQAIEGGPRLHDHGEHAAIPVPYEPEHNIAAKVEIVIGDPVAAMGQADFVVDEEYNTHQTSHCCIETHVVASYLDANNRLVIVTATQVPFHARRIVSRVLDVPIGTVRVIKPRIGGGFGAKQEVILEPYAALVTLQTGRAVRCEFSRHEEFIASRTRHPMRIRLSTGVSEDGTISALTMDAQMNTGAYGSHALTVLSNAGAKVLPLFNKIENLSFSGRAVYTNLPVGGAYRGYGATQGYFALNQQIDIICRRLGLDPVEYCRKWHIKAGETSKVFEALGEGKEGVSQIVTSCTLSECIDRGAAEIGWSEKRDKRAKDAHDRVHGVGMAIAMQGSGIPLIDMASASIKMNEDGSFNLYAGATDLGTGSDTILVQIAAETLKIEASSVQILSSDTDLTPFDVGAYASSTTYVSGNAVKKCALDALGQIRNVACRIIAERTGSETDADSLVHADAAFTDPVSGETATFEEVAYRSLYSADLAQIQGQASFSGVVSPPPFIAQFAEVAVDPETGEVQVAKFVSAVDCGQPINPALAEGQIEGAVVNGISFALTEEFLFSASGRMTNASFGRYGIFTAADAPAISTILVPSYEESGPYGAKSVGEIGINGPAPAIANAIFDAVGVRLRDLPMTSERVYAALRNARGE